MNNQSDSFVILSTDDGDYEALYRNGRLLDEGARLGAGDRFYWLKTADQFAADISQFKEYELTEEDTDLINRIGNAPEFITEFKGGYPE